MKNRRKKRKKKQQKHVQIFSFGAYHPEIVIKFSFIKSAPGRITLETFRTMAFEDMAIFYEKYAVARFYTINNNVQKEPPLLTCWHPSNAIRDTSHGAFNMIHDMIFGDIFPTEPTVKNAELQVKAERIMTHAGSSFMKNVAQTFNRNEEFQAYMNNENLSFVAHHEQTTP